MYPLLNQINIFLDLIWLDKVSEVSMRNKKLTQVLQVCYEISLEKDNVHTIGWWNTCVQHKTLMNLKIDHSNSHQPSLPINLKLEMSWSNINRDSFFTISMPCTSKKLLQSIAFQVVLKFPQSLMKSTTLNETSVINHNFLTTRWLAVPFNPINNNLISCVQMFKRSLIILFCCQ